MTWIGGTSIGWIRWVNQVSCKDVVRPRQAANHKAVHSEGTACQSACPAAKRCRNRQARALQAAPAAARGQLPVRQRRLADCAHRLSAPGQGAACVRGRPAGRKEQHQDQHHGAACRQLHQPLLRPRIQHLPGQRARQAHTPLLLTVAWRSGRQGCSWRHRIRGGQARCRGT